MVEETMYLVLQVDAVIVKSKKVARTYFSLKFKMKYIEGLPKNKPSNFQEFEHAVKCNLEFLKVRRKKVRGFINLLINY